ncbi:hypothetical protein M0R04_01280 [Candidatus Dojkabacteria bacterium]|jgi:hypothetical protein|nr:hypothetical protein [Candidatus Dojkabacteria bacterium]
MNDFENTKKLIKSRGYYTLEFRPVKFDSKLMTDLKTVREYIQSSQISLRGWSFPFIPASDKKYTEIYNKNDCVESWIAMDHYLETWEMFQSGLFIDLVGFKDDWYSESGFAKGTKFEKIEPNKWYDAISAIYEVTEFMLFFSNLANKLDTENFYIKITLNNIKNRRLTTFDPGRWPIDFEYTSKVETITWEKELQKDLLIANNLLLAKEVIKVIYTQFNWNSFSENLIDSEQKKLIERRI